MKIGFMDSGIGGLSVLHEALHMLPNEEYLFYADVDHVPYGLKTTEQILGYVTEITEFLIDKKCDIIVVACNTATAVAIDSLRNKFDIPIIGMEPAVKPAVLHSNEKRVMVMATPVTIRENKLKMLIAKVDEEHKCDLIPMPRLVNFAEMEIFEDPDVSEYIKNELKQYNLKDYSELVLGCTHFNYFKPAFRQLFGNEIEFIDGNKGTVKHLADVLGLPVCSDENKVYYDKPFDLIYNSNVVYFASGRVINDEHMLTHIMRLHNRLEEVRYV
ncbi:glutamate racemase [Eubacterium ruminantium]|nr:glutamate racemase [Eubacterium ruminantium]